MQPLHAFDVYASEAESPEIAADLNFQPSMFDSHREGSNRDTAEAKSNEPAGCEVPEFMYGHGEAKTGEIEEERQIRLRFQAAELVDYDGEENAYAKPDNKAKGAFLGARRRKDSGVENRSDRNGFPQVWHRDA